MDDRYHWQTKWSVSRGETEMWKEERNEKERTYKRPLGGVQKKNKPGE